MIGTLLVLTHFLLRKIGITCSDPPTGWPAYVCNTHEGGARPTRTPTTTSSTVSGPYMHMGATGPAGMGQGPASVVTGAPGTASVGVPTAGAPSAGTFGTASTGRPASAGGRPASASQVAVPVQVVEAVKSPCVITIPNPPFPGSRPCSPPKFYEAQKMPFVIESGAQGTTVAPGGNTLDPDDDNCITVSPAGVVTQCKPKSKPSSGVGSPGTGKSTGKSEIGLKIAKSKTKTALK